MIAAAPGHADRTSSLDAPLMSWDFAATEEVFLALANLVGPDTIPRKTELLKPDAGKPQAGDLGRRSRSGQGDGERGVSSGQEEIEHGPSHQDCVRRPRARLRGTTGRSLNRAAARRETR